MTRPHNQVLHDSSRYDVYGRLQIEGIILDDVLGYNPLIRADWGHQIDQRAAAGTIQLRVARGAAMGDAAPRGGKSFLLETATVTKGLTPAGLDWQPVFDGRIDDFDRAGGEFATLTCRDRMAYLLERVIEPPPGDPPLAAWGFTSGGSGLTATANHIAQTAFGGVNPYPIFEGSDPEWTVVPFLQDAGLNVAEAINAKALERAWAFHYRYHDFASIEYPGIFLLYDPDTIGGDATEIPPSAMLRIHKLAAGTVDIRNVIELIWGASTRVRVKDEDLESVDRYGRKYEMLTEHKTSQIDTEEEAERMLAGALTQQKDPVIEFDYERFYYFPVQLCDRQLIQANGYHFDFSFTQNVVGYNHTLSAKQFRSTIRTRGGAGISHSKLWRNNRNQKMAHVTTGELTGIAPEYAVVYTVDDLTLPPPP